MTGVKRLGNVYRKPPAASTMSFVPPIIGFAYDTVRNLRKFYFSDPLGLGNVDNFQKVDGGHEIDGLVVCPAVYNNPSVFDKAVLGFLEKYGITTEGFYLVNMGARCDDDFYPDKFRMREEATPDLDIFKECIKDRHGIDIESGIMVNDIQTVAATSTGIFSRWEFLYGMEVEGRDHMMFSSTMFNASFSADGTFGSSAYCMDVPKIGFKTTIPKAPKGFDDKKDEFALFMGMVDGLKMGFDELIYLVAPGEVDKQLGCAEKEFTGRIIFEDNCSYVFEVLKSSIEVLKAGGLDVVVGDAENPIVEYDREHLKVIEPKAE
jgi:hypothetical protein